MSRLLTRAEIRDWVRRRFNIVPPIDQIVGSPLWGTAGQQPSYAPQPSNAQINDAIDEALAVINTRTGFHGFHFDLTIPAFTGTIGAQQVKLSLIDSTEVTNNTTVNASIGLSNINTVRRVLWTDGGSGNTLPVQLLASPVIQSDLALVNFDAMPPGIPTNYFIEGYTLYMYPASLNGGTLTLWCGTGLLNPINDGSSIDQLPADYHIWVYYNVMVQLAAIKTMSREMQELAASYGPKAEMGVEQIGAYYTSLSSQKEQGSISFQSPRSAYGLRRRRR